MDKKSFLKGLLCGIGASLVALFVAVGVFSCATGSTAKKEETSGVKALRQNPKFVDVSGDIPSVHGWRGVSNDYLKTLGILEYGSTQTQGESVDLFGSFDVFDYEGNLWTSDNLSLYFEDQGSTFDLLVCVAKWDNADTLDYVPHPDGDYSAVCVRHMAVGLSSGNPISVLDYVHGLFKVNRIDSVSWNWSAVPADLGLALETLFPSLELGFGIGDSFVVEANNFVPQVADEQLNIRGDVRFELDGVSYYGTGSHVYDVFGTGGSLPRYFGIGFGTYESFGKIYRDASSSSRYVKVGVGGLGITSDSLDWLLDHSVRYVPASVVTTNVVWDSASFRPAVILQQLYGGDLVYNGYVLACNARNQSGSQMPIYYKKLISFDGVLFDEIQVGWMTLAQGDVNASSYAYYDGENYVALDATDLGGKSCLALVTYVRLLSYDGVDCFLYQIDRDAFLHQGYYLVNGYLNRNRVTLDIYDYVPNMVVWTDSYSRLDEYGLFVSPCEVHYSVNGLGWFGSSIDPFNLLKSGIASMVDLLSISVLPGLTLGLLFSLPLLAVLVVLVFKVIHK